jgi:flagellin-like protein
MINSKRGLSAVIATVLLLLITISAVVIIAGVILPFITGNLESSTECVDFRGYFTFEEKFEFGGDTLRYNCYQDADGDGSNELYGASIRAGVNKSGSVDELVGFDLVYIVKQGAAKTVKVRDGEESEGVLLLSGESVSVLRVPGPGEVRTYVYEESGGSEYEKVEVYPVLSNDRICDMSDEIELRRCTPGNVDLVVIECEDNSDCPADVINNYCETSARTCQVTTSYSCTEPGMVSSDCVGTDSVPVCSDCVGTCDDGVGGTGVCL